MFCGFFLHTRLETIPKNLMKVDIPANINDPKVFNANVC